MSVNQVIAQVLDLADGASCDREADKLIRKAVKLSGCGLPVGLTEQGHEIPGFCGQRFLCPSCAKRKQNKDAARAYERTSLMVRSIPTATLWFGTLMVPEFDSIKEQKEWAQKKLKQLWRMRRENDQVSYGFIWTFEAVKGASGRWRGHFHLIVFSKFARAELEAFFREKWAEVAWGAELRPMPDDAVDFRPFDSMGVKAGELIPLSTIVGIDAHRAISYASKPATKLSIDERLEVQEDLHGKRLSGTTGVFFGDTRGKAVKIAAELAIAPPVPEVVPRRKQSDNLPSPATPEPAPQMSPESFERWLSDARLAWKVRCTAGMTTGTEFESRLASVSELCVSEASARLC